MQVTKSVSTVNKTVPVVDIGAFLKGSTSLAECQAIANSMHDTGCVIIKDPRVNEDHNNVFLDMMEKYFESRGEMFYKGEKIEDIKPEYNYQVGATQERVEKARDHTKAISELDEQNKPLTTSPPAHDAKWRFFWRMENESSTNEPPQVVPKDFPDWEKTMNQWGTLMLGCTTTVSEMLAVGLDLEKDAFSSRMKKGPHLLAPTGSDLARYNKDTIFAGFHYGKSYDFLLSSYTLR